ncbi:MAG: hypothetical protein K1X64_04705 [Myxococcaceae bacterium]|nr:hypothetical protein [Myxococcaceae bacterium]
MVTRTGPKPPPSPGPQLIGPPAPHRAENPKGNDGSTRVIADNGTWELQSGPAAPSDVSVTVVESKNLLDIGKEKVLNLAFDEAGKEHGFDKSISFGLARGTLKLTEQVGVRDTKGYDALVAPDRRRREYAETHPNSLWVKTTAMVGASGAIPLGTRATFGLGGSVEVSALMVHDKPAGVKDGTEDVKLQIKGMAVPVTAEGLQSLKPAPGSEFFFRGMLNENLSASIGRSQSVGGPHVTASVAYGAGVSGSNSDIYTKNVKVLEDGKVYVRIGKSDQKAASVSVGAQGRVHIVDSDDTLLTDFLPSLEGRKAELAKKSEELGQKTLVKEIEKRLQVDVSRQRSITMTDQALGAVVLDLNRPEDVAAYDFLLKASPSDAVEFLKNTGRGVRAETSTQDRARSRGIRFGRFNMLSVSSHKTSGTGTVEQKGKKTTMAQAGFSKSVEGILPRFFLDEERQVEIRAGELIHDGEPAERAVAISLAVSDPRFTAFEVDEAARFARAMDTDLALPAMQKGTNLGKTKTELQAVLTTSHIERLLQRSPEDIRLANAAAHMEINGQKSLGPAFENPERFAYFRRRYLTPETGRQDEATLRVNASIQYAQEFPGRDLWEDIDADKTAQVMSEQITALRGMQVEDWAPMLQLLAERSSRDIRAALLALKRLAGAEITELSISSEKVKASATPQGKVPQTMDQFVESVLAATE